MTIEQWQEWRKQIAHDDQVVPAHAVQKMIDLGEQQAIRLASIIINVEPDDVIAITFPGPISAYFEECLTGMVKEIWPHNKIMVLGDAPTISVMRKT